ncbi:PDZ domain-containing protein [Planctomyces sp. SH-PL62]|uniref:PDZ domain-containing protein n=1 Tax=Planctomyces sp. SH-PL62 TaxID=1636152 RepID=UPI00078B9472|nr:PDZ domain-containing protein [Planctomyces sp. SH-PL62]AMV40815.1 Putative serine protease HtrA [Planctomyces sp. SH-PL62]
MIHKFIAIAATLGLVGVAAAVGLQGRVQAQDKTGGPVKDPQIGRAFRVPYRLTDTNHFLVRVRINGKGPFNFLVDSGAPALYVATETAAKIGLAPPEKGFWTPVDSLEIEGGARLEKVKARVEDPFQLVGMNALGLPGASIDGILGFTILARFKLEIDLTRDRMTWTRLDFVPRDPPVPTDEDRRNPPVEMQLMNALGPVAKGLAFLIGKQPEEQLAPRGFLGLEWAESADAGAKAVRVVRVLPDSPAARAGVEAGDALVRIDGKPVEDLGSARESLSGLRQGQAVELVVKRGGEEKTLKATAGEGL